MTGFGFPHPASGAQAAGQHADVYIEVGVLPTQLASVRVIAADLAARADFDLDSVSDLRIAVDEACSTLATLATHDARLRCTMEIDPDRITVTVRVTAPIASKIPQDTFGWRVLDTLIDEVEVLTEDGSVGGTLGIRLVKDRQTGTA